MIRPFLLLAALLSIFVVSPAQERPDDDVVRIPRRDPGNPADGPRNNSQLRKYPFVEDLVERADRAVQAKKWNDALDIYVQAVEKYPDHVLPASGHSNLFVSVREYVVTSLRRWPDEGRRAYQLRFDPIVKSYLDQARTAWDVPRLKGLVASYPFSTYADDILSLLAGMALDRNEPLEALEYLRRLEDDPGDVPASSVLGRMAQAYVLLGDRKSLSRLAKKIETDHAAETIVMGDRIARLSEVVNGMVKSMPETRRAPAEETTGWTMMGGNPEGTYLPRSLPHFPRPAWSVALAHRRPEADDYEFMIPGSSWVKPLHPAVNDGVLYVHNGWSAHAYNLFARGQESPLWTFRVPSLPVLFEERAVYATTVHHGKVFVNLITGIGDEERKLGGIYVKIPFPRRTLFALDAYSGKEIWRIGGGSVNPARFEDGLSFSMAPVPDGEVLYVPAVRQANPTDPFEHYLVCLEADTGRTKWIRFVASGLTEINLFGNSTREALPSPVAVAGDTVFTATNLGAAAALDKHTGAMKWAYQYEQVPVPYTRAISIVLLPMEWTIHPPFAAHGLFLFAPLDASDLFALDQKTGQMRWKIKRPPDAHSVWGVFDRTLVVGGSQLYTYDILADGKLIHADSAVKGDGLSRGAITGNTVYAPTSSRIVALDPRTYKWTDELPGPYERGANVFVADHALIVTTQDAIHVYNDIRSAEKEVLEDLSKDPDNPDRVYRLALTLVQMGRDREALAHFQKAAGLIRDWDSPRRRQVRAACERRIEMLAMAVGRERMAAGDHEEAEKQFRTAMARASLTSSVLEAALALGEVLQARDRPAEALAVYQDLLRNRGSERHEGRAVWERVRPHVERLLAKSGRDLYRDFEKQAEELKQKALSARSPEALMEIITQFSNSVAAEDAFLAAASLRSGNRQSAEAIHILREYLAQFPESSRTPQATVDLVLLLEQQKLHGVASFLLKDLEKKSPSATVSVGDTRRAVKDLVAERLKRPEYQLKYGQAAPVRLRVPLSKRWSVQEKLAASMTPLRPSWQEAESQEFVLMQLGTRVRALRRRDGVTAWEAMCNGVMSNVFAADGALIFTGRSSAVRVDPATGKVVWTYAPDQRYFSSPAVGGRSLFLASQKLDGTPGLDVVALNLADGRPLWIRTVEDLSSSLVPLQETVAFSTPGKIMLLDAGTGAIRLEQDLSTGGLPASMVYADPALVCCYVNTQWLAGYETSGGRRAWAHSLQDRQLLAVEALSGYLVYMSRPLTASGAGRARLTLLSLEDGKIIREKTLDDTDDVPIVKVSAEYVYVISRKPDRTPTVQALALATLEKRWAAELPIATKFYNLLPPVVASEHLAVPILVRDAQNEWSYQLHLLDRRGDRVQTVTSEKSADRPPRGELVGENLVIQTESMVELYSGGKD